MVFQDRVSLYSPGCPGTHFVDQAGLKLRNPPVSAFQVLGLKACATTPSPAFSTNGAGSMSNQNVEEMQIDPFLSACTKLKSRWIKNLHIKPDTVKLIEKTEETVGKSLEYMGTGKKFLNRTPMAYALRSTIDKWDFIKLQSFYKAKDIVNRTRLQPIDGEKVFMNPTSNRGLISFLFKEFKKLDSSESNNPIKNGVQS